MNLDTGSDSDNYLLTGSLSLLGFQMLAEVPAYARYNPGVGETLDGFGKFFVSGAFSLPLIPVTHHINPIRPNFPSLTDSLSD